jgi:exoribonuclease-2
MHVFFEDDGQLKAGTVLADNDSSLQVEAASGKRLKIKSASVLLRYSQPSPTQLLAEAQRETRELDPNFLWEVSGDDDFGYADLARDYYGHSPGPVEAAAVAMALAAAPMYFYKRGKGRYRKAPPRRSPPRSPPWSARSAKTEQMSAWVDDLRAGRLPDAMREKLSMLLYKPDKNTLEWKALAAASEAAQKNPVALLASCGAIPVDARISLQRVSGAGVPQGSGFAPYWIAAIAARAAAGRRARVFHRRRDDDGSRRCILGARARERELRDRHSHRRSRARHPARLAARCDCARAALHRCTCRGASSRCCPMRSSSRSRSRRAGVRRRCPCMPRSRRRATSSGTRRAQPRADGGEPESGRVDPAFANELPSSADPPWTEELRALWKFAQRLSDARGKADFTRIDYSFQVDWDRAVEGGEQGYVRIVPATSRQPARQAHLRAHDLRQQRMGEAARGSAGRGPLPDAGQRQGQDEHPPRRASRDSASPTTCGRARRFADTAIS